MADFLFYLFAVITVLSAGGIILSRNPVNAAMMMIVSFVGVASLFVFLGAYFLAVVQVAVYAGAVVVLFLFIIMLLNVDTVARIKEHTVSVLAGCVAGGLLLIGILRLIMEASVNDVTLADAAPVGETVASFGMELFTTYMLPFQVAGLLLLVAMLGVIFISKRTVKQEPSA